MICFAINENIRCILAIS